MKALRAMALPWCAVALLTTALYALTASTGIGWQDFGEFVLRIYDPQLAQEWGLARWHPLHFILTRLSVAALPRHPPLAVTLVSGVFGAISVANVYGITRQLTARNSAAILAAGGLALSHTFWRLSSHPECYTISTAALTAELWALVCWAQSKQPRWLVLMMFCNGIGLANHNLALLTLPVLGVVLLLALVRKEAGVCVFFTAAGAWLAAAGLYLILIVQQMLSTGDITSTIRSALVGNFERQAMGLGFQWRNTAVSVAFTLLSFPNFFLPAAGVGMIVRSPDIPKLIHRSLLASLLIHLAFVLRYNVPDQYTFLLPAYAILAIFAGLGVNTICMAWSGNRAKWVVWLSAASVLVTPAIYLEMKVAAEKFKILGSQARQKPYRNDYNYLFLPWGSGENSADRMSSEAVALAGPRGLIAMEDPMGSFAVRYQIAFQRQKGIEEIDAADHSRIEQAVRDGRTVVFVPARTGDAAPAILDKTPRKVGELWVFEP